MAIKKLILDGSVLDSADRVENSNYICHIYTQGSNNEKRSIRLPIPEEFNFALATQFSQPWAQGFSQNTFMKNLNTLGSITGAGVSVTQSQTLQVWQGTSEVNFQLTFELVANRDPYEEVVQPIKDLLWLMLPGTTNEGGKGLLVPPGPSIDVTNVASWLSLRIPFKNEITLDIGNFIRFDSVVIENVNHVFDAHFISSGLPTSARVDVSFKTFVAPVKNDIDRIFAVNRSAANGGNNGTRGGQ